MFYFAETNYIPSFYLLRNCCDQAISSNTLLSGLKCWWSNNTRGDSSFKYIKLLAVAWLLFTHHGMTGLGVCYSQAGFLQVTFPYIHSCPTPLCIGSSRLSLHRGRYGSHMSTDSISIKQWTGSRDSWIPGSNASPAQDAGAASFAPSHCHTGVRHHNWQQSAFVWTTKPRYKLGKTFLYFI